MKRLIILAGTLALAAAPAALAKPGNGHGNSAAAHGQNNAGHGDGDHRATGAGVDENGVWTNPAGRKHPHGMPPGQARKIAGRNGGLVAGNVLPTSYPGYQQLRKASSYDLPAAPAGYSYVRVGANVYLRQTTSGVISSVFQNLTR